jgi:hypothetical protein
MWSNYKSVVNVSEPFSGFVVCCIQCHFLKVFHKCYWPLETVSFPTPYRHFADTTDPQTGSMWLLNRCAVILLFSTCKGEHSGILYFGLLDFWTLSIIWQTITEFVSKTCSFRITDWVEKPGNSEGAILYYPLPEAFQHFNFPTLVHHWQPSTNDLWIYWYNSIAS